LNRDKSDQSDEITALGTENTTVKEELAIVKTEVQTYITQLDQ